MATTSCGKGKVRKSKDINDAVQDSGVQSTPSPEDTPVEKRPRLRKLIVSNLRCIGSNPVEVDLDEIVVLVGPNNVGKSTILRAYWLVLNDGSAEAKISAEDFPNGKIDPKALPTVELHTIVHPDVTPGPRWVADIGGEKLVKERWVWNAPNELPKRTGFDVEKRDWSDEGGVPWGAANVANARRPAPQRIEAFTSPEKQTAQVSDLLLKMLRQQVAGAATEVKENDGSVSRTKLGEVLDSLASIQSSIVEEVRGEIEKVEKTLSNLVSNVFDGYKVAFDAKPEESLRDALSFFKAGAELRMGPSGGYLSPIDRQGSGARRTLMWAVLRYLADHQPKRATARPNLLLLDEPELCLHPHAVRSACRALYDLPSQQNWQVMVTTHCPAFVDLSRDNTTIVRVDRDGAGQIGSTTVFRPSAAKLDADEKRELKLLNACDPYVAEFLFGGQTVLVEGDTEHTAFRYSQTLEDSASLNRLHVVRARGKAILVLLAKILNQFGGSYALLHDADTPTIKQKSGKVVTNGAWTTNTKVLEVASQAKGKVRLVASISNFEEALFGKNADDEKPYNALLNLRQHDSAAKKARRLLHALVDFNQELPPGFVEWNDIGLLEIAVSASEPKVVEAEQA